jgi:hypothetical protein
MPDAAEKAALRLVEFDRIDALWLRDNCGGWYPCRNCIYRRPDVPAGLRHVRNGECLDPNRPDFVQFLAGGGCHVA